MLPISRPQCNAGRFAPTRAGSIRNALILEPTKEVELRFVAIRIEADLCGFDLSEKLGKLAQLHERGVGILGEIALGEHAKADELIVVDMELREIGTRTCQLSELLLLVSHGCRSAQWPFSHLGGERKTQTAVGAAGLPVWSLGACQAWRRPTWRTDMRKMR